MAGGDSADTEPPRWPAGPLRVRVTEPEGAPRPAAGTHPPLPCRSAAPNLAKFQADLVNQHRMLGTGSFGVVKLFKDRFTGEQRAVKYVPLDCSESLAEWEREESVLLSLAASRDLNSAQHIVRLFSSWVGAVDSTKTGVFVMEACDRSVLEDIQRRAPRPAPLAAALTWAVQLMRGLAFLHGLDLLHRDLKPNNVLLQGAGDSAVLKIADLGSSRRGAALMTAAVATLPYRAPEILMGAEITEAGPVTIQSSMKQLPKPNRPSNTEAALVAASNKSGTGGRQRLNVAAV